MSTLLRFSGAVRRSHAIEEWLDSHPNPLGDLARHWFAVIRRCGPDVRELMHDGYATACVEDAPFAYVGVFKAHVNVGFFQGATLADPEGLLEGTGKYMRHVKIRPGAVLADSHLEAIIDASYRDIGIKLRSIG